MSLKLPAFFDIRVKKAESNSRVRSKEHVPGNWPTIIFIPINLSEEALKLINENISHMNFEPVDPITISPQSTYHLSLSRTLYLKEHQKELFHRKIAGAFKKILVEFPLPETIETEKFSVYLNDEKTRTFIAIDLRESESIFKYIEVIDSVLKEFGLPVYYSSPKLHFSVVWCQGNRSNDVIFEAAEKEEINLKIELKQILIKCGNKVSTIN